MVEIHARRVVFAELLHHAAAATHDVQLHQIRIVFMLTQLAEDAANVLFCGLPDADRFRASALLYLFVLYPS